MNRGRIGTGWCLGAAVAALLSASCGGGSTPQAQPTTPAPSTSASSPPSSPAPTAPPSTPAPFGYQPLWPFADAAAAAAWQQAYRGNGQQAWHLDAGRTALSFTRDYLHITDVDRVTSRKIAGSDARIGVGFATEGGRTGTAAVVHVVRIGSGADAPWEVVGTDDTLLTLTKPAYGARVSSPVAVGGRITGVDENLKVTVYTLTSAGAVGSACCVPAGGSRTPWSIRVSYQANRGQVLTIVVTTGGHLLGVERFAVTGVRAR